MKWLRSRDGRPSRFARFLKLGLGPPAFLKTREERLLYVLSSTLWIVGSSVVATLILGVFGYGGFLAVRWGMGYGINPGITAIFYILGVVVMLVLAGHIKWILKGD